MLTVLCGCQSIINKLKDPEIDAAAEQLIKDIMGNHMSDVVDVLHPALVASLNGDYSSIIQMKDYIEGSFSTFEITSVYVNKNISNGITTYTYDAVYLLKTSTEKEYYIHMLWLENTEGSGFTTCMVLVDDTTNTATGLNTVMKVISIILLVFAFITLIICLRTKMEKKLLFAVLIILLYFGFSITSSNNGVHFNLNFFNYFSEYVSNSNGDMFNLCLPIGALLFWSLRKKLKQSYADKQKFLMNLLNPEPANPDSKDALSFENKEDISPITANTVNSEFTVDNSTITLEEKEEKNNNNEETK